MIKKITSELLRRGVLRAVGAYIAIIWLLAQGVVDVFPAIGLPDWTMKMFLVVSISGTPLIAVLSWKYDLTKRGLLRDKRDRASLVPLANLMRSDPTRSSGERTVTDRTIINVSWTDQDGQVREREFNSEFVIGRDYNTDIRVIDSRVSRRHIKVYPDGDHWLVEDLVSLNGSYVDGVPFQVRRVDAETRISLDKDGPRITLTPRIAEPTLMTQEPS